MRWNSAHGLQLSLLFAFAPGGASVNSRQMACNESCCPRVTPSAPHVAALGIKKALGATLRGIVAWTPEMLPTLAVLQLQLVELCTQHICD